MLKKHQLLSQQKEYNKAKRAAMKKYGFAKDDMINDAVTKGKGPKISVDFIYHQDGKKPIISYAPLTNKETGKELPYGADGVTESIYKSNRL